MTIHFADLLRFYLGEVEEVTAYTQELDRPIVTSALLRFASGAAGLLSSGSHLDWQGPTEYLEIAGDGGQVVVDNAVVLRHATRAPDPARMIFPGEPTRVWRPNYTPIGSHLHTFTLLGYVAEVQHFAACLPERRTPEVTIQDGDAAMRVCRALFDSRGRPVQLKDVL